MNPPDAIGYCAVVCPSIDHYQAYFIVDNEAIRANATHLQMTALMTASQAAPIGALQAVLLDGALTHNQTMVGAAALALKGITKQRFFYIIGEKEPEGFRTEQFELDVETIDQAREAINRLPQVKAIQQRLSAKLSMRDGRGRKKAFH